VLNLSIIPKKVKKNFEKKIEPTYKKTHSKLVKDKKNYISKIDCMNQTKIQITI